MFAARIFAMRMDVAPLRASIAREGDGWVQVCCVFCGIVLIREESVRGRRECPTDRERQNASWTVESDC